MHQDSIADIFIGDGVPILLANIRQKTLNTSHKPARRSFSLLTVVLILFVIMILQTEISYSANFGGLENYVSESRRLVASGWLILRGGLILAVILLWVFNHRLALFRTIIIANGFLTFGLLMNMSALMLALVGFNAGAAELLIMDVVLMAVTNILIFSIWYWIIDPPGVEETQRVDEPWDFLFPQRSDALPNYENWQPRYTDYLYIAFTTSFAFSPTDALPLTRRAKMLMLLQSAVSIIILTGIASSAINILVGSS